MDSVIGSIYLAFYLEKNNDLGKKYYIPTLNFEKEDLPLRNDVAKLLSLHGVATENVFSVIGRPGMPDYIDLQKVAPEVILYDHNKLISSQSFLSDRVIGVIDHHADEKLYMDQTISFRRIETAGSACTLVAELFREAELRVPCAELLLAPIVLDTVNYNPSQKKVTDRDIQATQWLLEQTTTSIDLTNLFSELSAWKTDVLGLSVSQHLRRDYKNFEFPFKESNAGSLQIGISSISCRIDEVLASRSMEEFMSNCLEFLTLRKLDVLLLAFAGVRGPGNYCRQIAFLARGMPFQALKDYAGSSPDNVVFTLLSTTQSKEWTLLSYELSDPSVSRKKLAPSLGRFLSSWSKL
ncbi:putative acidocalcisomal exopolyphosphatase [Trypanosoma grayi]|uniref:putative acidocalcisomal exopolyphosphatase n=1 Tax=Trypanosoma grayi TaxID=71804 RepID=UPI0004F4BCC6|nr:putative acidocalcisomal exopolyphosphatase [Trypanosoma grayi]KEG10685.1 putative acidocalcisomal exopolyphosphatase [Trypanosoma grayi]